jgi:hypothetical protein
MKWKLFSWVLTIFVLFGTMVPIVFAQDKPRPAATSIPRQEFLVEYDYGLPLNDGISVGYIFDQKWEASFGLSLDPDFGGVGPVDFFICTLQARYNLNERVGLKGGVFQPYAVLGCAYISGTQTGYAYSGLPANANTTDQDLQLGLGLEYFILSDLGVGLTLSYTKTLFRTNSKPNVNVFFSPSYVWDLTTSTDTSIIFPNFYLQLRI